MVREDRLIFAELKKEKGKTSPEQDAWLEALKITGAEVYVWRPSQLREVIQILQKKPE